MGEPVEEVAESLSKVSVGGGEENVIYASDSRGSDEAGEKLFIHISYRKWNPPLDKGVVRPWKGGLLRDGW